MRRSSRNGASTRSRPVEVSVFPDTTLSRGGVPDSFWTNTGMAARLARRGAVAAAARRSSRAARGSAPAARRSHRCGTVSLFAAVKRRAGIPVLAVGGIRTAAEVARHPRPRRGRPRRHRPPLLRRARPRGPHPRRRRGPGPVPQLQPLRRRADARHEGRLLQPRRPPDRRYDSRSTATGDDSA